MLPGNIQAFISFCELDCQAWLDIRRDTSSFLERTTAILFSVLPMDGLEQPALPCHVLGPGWVFDHNSAEAPVCAPICRLTLCVGVVIPTLLPLVTT